jgi:hypothetical protein
MPWHSFPQDETIVKWKTWDEQMTWYVLFDADPHDALEVKRLFQASGFSYDEIDGKFALNAPAFNFKDNEQDVIEASMELATSVNTALRLSLTQYSGLMFWGIVEKKSDGSIRRTIMAQSNIFGQSGVAALGEVGSFGTPTRTREERLVSLIQRNDEVADIAVGLTPHPLTWGAMSKTYESVVGLMSTRKSNKRQDFHGLINRGWLTLQESEIFYNSAAYHRHGYPKTPVRGGILMDHTTAKILIDRLFWLLVDELEPT